jgi:peptidoglycan lytic transglycosylase
MKMTILGLALLLSVLLCFGCASVPHGHLAADLARVGAESVAPAPTAVARAVSAAQIGVASFYHSALVGRLTANGERYDERALTAAHRTLDLGTRVRVTNLENRKSVVVTVNDRGPYAKGRIIDLSRRAARVLGFVHDGVTRVKVEPLT